ncbi:MAG: NAD(P)H-hydrate dehydratase [Gammaproteobacteria bacterium]
MDFSQPLDFSSLKARLSSRLPTAHKGDFGTLLIIGGSPGMSGAVQMAGQAALRVGVGRVIIATHPDHAAFLNLTRPELMVYGVSDGSGLAPLLAQATHVLIGPGLAPGRFGESLFQVALSSHKPCVVDAGALTMLAQQPFTYSQGIFTPHPGEAARLLKISTAEVQKDRRSAVRRLHSLLNGVVILKGHETLICDGSGGIFMSPYGNPGMATAGMGDILAGVIGGLWPQVQTGCFAAHLGVALHGSAGDVAAVEGERGLIATDLLPHLRRLLG